MRGGAPTCIPVRTRVSIGPHDFEGAAKWDGPPAGTHGVHRGTQPHDEGVQVGPRTHKWRVDGQRRIVQALSTDFAQGRIDQHLGHSDPLAMRS